MNHLSQKQLLQLLYEKDCYIQALEQQLELSRQEIQLLRSQKQSFTIQNISSDEDCNLDENSEPAISASRVEQFQSSGKKIKLKAPLQDSNSFNVSAFRQSTTCLKQKVVESIDISNLTIDHLSIKNTEQQQQLFDDLVLLGITSDQSIEPNIIYSYNQLQNQSLMNQVSKFIFPDGCKPKIIPLSFSLEDINIMLNYNFQTESSNCFIILTKQTEQQQLKYYICYRFSEFTIINKEQVRFNKRALCISTSKYLIDIFIDTIVNILNQVKFLRQYQYQKTNNISLIDSKFFDQQISQICSKVLQQFHKKQIQDFISINHISFRLTELDQIRWGLPVLFSKFQSQSLIKLFVSCLTEKSIVFVSKSPQLSTAACLLCQKYLLKPFTWIHPIISNLPLENIVYLGSPVPIISGLECNFQNLQKQEILKKFQNTIFVNLDNKPFVQFENSDVIPLLSAELMTFLQTKLDEFFMKPKQDFQNFNQCLIILSQLFHNRVIRNIPIEPIRQNNDNRLKNKKYMLDYEKIAQKTLLNMGTINSDKFIWKQFFQTQIFIQFIDQYYH